MIDWTGRGLIDAGNSKKYHNLEGNQTDLPTMN